MPKVKFLSLAALKKGQNKHISTLRRKVTAEAEETVARQELLDSLGELIHAEVELVATRYYYCNPGYHQRPMTPEIRGIVKKMRGVVKEVGLDDASDQPLGYLDLIVSDYRGTWRILVPDIKFMRVLTTERPWTDVSDYQPHPREAVRYKQAETPSAT